MKRLFLNLIKNNLYIRNFSVSKKIVLNSQICKQDNLFILRKKKKKLKIGKI